MYRHKSQVFGKRSNVRAAEGVGYVTASFTHDWAGAVMQKTAGKIQKIKIKTRDGPTIE